jgi:hypothetical protein
MRVFDGGEGVIKGGRSDRSRDKLIGFLDEKQLVLCA